MSIQEFLRNRNIQIREAYRALPSLLREHYGIEETVLAGGYGYRQVVELVQNGADAILEQHESAGASASKHRLHVLLTDRWLYVANTGAPLTEQGIDSLLSSHSSPKRGQQIGRFGLGFKSLLRLGGKVDLFSATANAGMRFDPKRCRSELAAEFGAQLAPSLRLAWSIDRTEREADQVMRQFGWAETIVRAEIPTGSIREHVSAEIQSFAAEFLLFFSVPVELVLDDGVNPRRVLSTRRNGDTYELNDGVTTNSWRVFSRQVTISNELALQDATHIHARGEVPVAWAIPLRPKKEEAGRFWAFFPTQTHTYVPGIVNAPWKLNSDRNAIIGGEWNAALMDAAGELVAECVPKLWAIDDPGRPLDAFPRQMDRRDDPAAPFVESVWRRLESERTIADGSGLLREPRQLKRPPRDSPSLVASWNACGVGVYRALFVHPSCLDGQRSSRLNSLASRLASTGSGPDLPGLQREQPGPWFARVASAEELAFRRVLQLAELYSQDCTASEWETVRPMLAIVPAQNGELMTPDKLVLALDSEFVPGRSPVASFVLEHEELADAVRTTLKVKTLDVNFWRTMLSDSFSAADTQFSTAKNGEKWDRFWSILRSAPTATRDEFIAANKKKIRIKRRDGLWVQAHQLVLPGEWIPEDDPKYRKLLVDQRLHGPDEISLRSLGVGEWPDGTVGPGAYKTVVGDGESSLADWLKRCRDQYKRQHQNSAFPEYLDPKDLTLPAGWNLLESIDGLANARLIERILPRIAEGEFCQPLLLAHRTDARYQKMEIQHPLRAYLLQHGKVLIGDTAVALWTVLAMAKEPAFQGTRTWRRLESALHRFMGVEVLGGKPQPDSASFWKALLKAEAAIASPDPSVPMRELWTRAAMDGVVPDTVHIGTSGLPLSSVFVTSSEDLGRLAKRRARPTVILDETTLRIWVKAGAKRLDDLVLDSWESAGPDTLLISAVPELAEVMRPGDCVTGRYRPVTNLRLSLEGVPEEVPCLFRNGVMLLDLDRLFRCSRAARLESIVRELAGSGWLKCSVVDALRVLGDAGIDQRRAYVAAGATLPEKLLRAVGERREPLLEVLGDLSNLEFIRNRTALEIAHLVLALQGPGTFKDLQKTLEDEGLRPPQRWNGPEAGSFLESIGFPANFALPLDERREPEEFISGPMELRPLHDFQEEVLTGLKELLSSTSIRRRVVVSLPTGGGKTRVTVEAAVRLILAPPSGARSVLWVAQTDELCEQAVQSFKQVWVNLGALGTDLRIIRLWGGNPNPASHPRKDPVVVVASIQTLNSRIRSESLNWLNEPGIVVVDECHHAITPSYTNLLRWLDMMPSKAAAEKRPEPPIVGLSATPFRTDEDESTRLAKRFDNAWLPSDQPSLYSRLRAQGVLAEPIYEALDSGVMLLAEEIDRFSAMPQPWEGLEFENLLEQLNQRLATIESRSEKIVDVIQRSSERAILLFANSVIHGEEMAARLNLAGIPAAAVSGTSSPAVRRYFLDCFKRGELRVLCNHSVLTTGFDAPNTDMVLIARQVFSPVRYMQIVGRGLRGIKNGGTAVCRIVTVMDNLGRFKDRHPFYYCQHNFAAWTGSEV